MVCVGRYTTAPVSQAGIDRGMKDVGKIIRNCREVAARHVEPKRPNTDGREPVPIGGMAETGRAPHFVALRERSRDRESDLPGGPRDKDFLAVEHKHLQSLQRTSLGCEDLPMSILVGTPSDDAPAIVATGRGDINTLFVSMSARHPEGHDADYLAWHSLDHRPEQHRLASLRASIRLVSTPACRAARAVSNDRYDATDHLMTYLFKDVGGLAPFGELATALAQAGRMPYLLPAVERAVYRLSGTLAAPRIKAGADVLPWWPARGVYVLLERGEQAPSELIDVPGVGGIWWGSSLPELKYTTAQECQECSSLTGCFLDEDPVSVGREFASPHPRGSVAARADRTALRGSVSRPRALPMGPVRTLGSCAQRIAGGA